MRWETPDLKQRSIDAVTDCLSSGDERIRLRAVALVVAMEAQNQSDQHKAVDVDQSSRNRFLEVAQQLGISTDIASISEAGPSGSFAPVIDYGASE